MNLFFNMNTSILLLVFLFDYGNFQRVCPNFITCESADNSNSCPPGTFYKEKVKVNGCCPACLSLKGENENCESAAECQPGLTCENVCRKDPEQACEYYKLFDPIWKIHKYWKPQCLPDGTFAPKQCKGEKMSGKCFCTDEMGNRIFGETEWSTAENMTCVCSRLAEKLKQKNLDTTLHCDPVGNFEPLQCDRKVCWCASPKTGIPYTIMVPLEMITSLPCYNGNQYFKQCDSGNNMESVIKSLLWNHGTKSFPQNIYECNFDGSYHRVQRLGEKKRCIYVDQSLLTEAVTSENANCNCAFDRHVAKLTQTQFLMKCLPNGNYSKRQTWNGKIYCVDEDGFHYSNNPNDCSL